MTPNQMPNKAQMPTRRIFIGLGTNIEPRRAYLAQALEHLQRLADGHQIAQSSVIETEPIDMSDDSGRFLNQVVSFDCSLPALELLQKLKEIEKKMGRKSKGERRARTIDLDLLLCGDEIIVSDELMIPHQSMTERTFVLEPLAQLALELVHPKTGIRFSDYLNRLTGTLPPLSDRKPVSHD